LIQLCIYSNVYLHNQANEESTKELDAEKLHQYQKEVAEGGGTDNPEMMNVAVVSDIGWKGGGGEPAATQDDVWAQVKFSVSILCIEFSVYYV